MPPNQSVPRLSQAAGQFLDYAHVDLRFAPQSIEKYTYCLKRVCCIIGDQPVTDISAADILKLKAEMLARGNSVC